MIQFDEHIFQRGLFNHQLGMHLQMIGSMFSDDLSWVGFSWKDVYEAISGDWHVGVVSNLQALSWQSKGPDPPKATFTPKK